MRSIKAEYTLENNVLKGSLGDKSRIVNEYGYERAIQYFQSNAASRPELPFFAYVQMVRPHYPYIADEFIGTFLPIQSGLTTPSSQWGYLMKSFSNSQQSVLGFTINL
jgi:hypothetical protein